RSLLEMLTQPKVVPHNPEMHTVHLPERPRQEPPRVTLADRLASAAVAATGLQFQPLAPPPMSRCEKVPYLHGFRLGDTYQLHSKLWLLPQLLCGALALTGILLTLVGIIMLQINKYLVSFVTMSIGVGTAGGGLSLILICAIVFLHAYCVIYNEGEHHKIQENVSLHVPAATTYHANMLELSNAIQPSQHQHQHDQDPAREQLQVNTRENGDSQPNVAVNGSNLVRCQSQYDNLQEITDDLV
uniref:Conserved plasma membrane protein n=1 Tax=Macrostomum lignano TaxID=282301 RepID=A0A1I8GM83_9PLAT